MWQHISKGILAWKKSAKCFHSHKDTHHGIQNELLHIMTSNVLRVKASTIHELKFFRIKADEGMDVSSIEQLFLCVKSVDDNLNVSENFIGFYELISIKSKTIINAIKDILLRHHLNLDDFHGQTYDMASNIIRKRLGVSTQTNPRWTTGSYSNSLSETLSKSGNQITPKDCTILRDVKGTVGEICVWVKYSSKQEKMLGSIVENIEGEFEESSRSDNQKRDKLCITRWAIRVKCFKKILDSYEALLELWEQSLKENFDFDTKSRIGSYKNQMKLLKFCFGLNLSQRFYAIMGNLWKTLLQEKISALRGKELCSITFSIQTLENIRNENYFSLLYKQHF